MSHELIRTDSFDEELFDIIYHVASSAHDRKTALEYLDEIEKHVSVLAEFLLAGKIPESRILSRQGFRILVVGRNHLVFYKVDSVKEQIILYHIVDARRNYVRLIR